MAGRREPKGKADAERWQKRIFFCCVGGVFLLMLVLNIFTPLIADDYTYSVHRVTKEPITSFWQILSSQYSHYFEWGGRSVVHTLAQLFLWMGKPFFTFINTVAYLALTLILYAHAVLGSDRKYQPAVFLLIHLLIWFTVPVFGQTVLWLVGSCNYLWGSLIIFGFLLRYRIALTGSVRQGWWWIPLWFLFGVLAGWCNENTSGMAVMLTILFLILGKLKGQKPAAWSFAGLAGVAIGFVVMILAPGNYVRSEYFEESSNIIIRYLTRFERSTDILMDEMLVLCLVFVALYVVLLYSHATLTQKLTPLLYFLGSLACNYAMVLSPIYPARARFGVMVTLVTACLSCLVEVEKAWPRAAASKTFGMGRWAVTGCLLFTFVFSYFTASGDLFTTWRMSVAREEYIESEKAAGNLNVQVSQIVPETSYNPLYGLEDIQSDPEHWVNQAAARYFGLESIRSYE